MIHMWRFGKPCRPNEDKIRKLRSSISLLLFLIIIFVIIIAVSIRTETILKIDVANEQVETWVASVASYWGGIIGGLVSGLFSFFAVFFTIRYYKDSDEKKEQAAVQPFLLIKTGNDNMDLLKGFSLGKQPENKEERKIINVEIKNIGNGFAKTLVIHTGFNASGLEFSKVINVYESANTYFVVDKNMTELEFGLQYIDSMTNEYIQNYTLKKEHGLFEIECGYPCLLKK